MTVVGATQALYLKSKYRPLPEAQGPSRGVAAWAQQVKTCSRCWRFAHFTCCLLSRACHPHIFEHFCLTVMCFCALVRQLKPPLLKPKAKIPAPRTAAVVAAAAVAPVAARTSQCDSEDARSEEDVAVEPRLIRRRSSGFIKASAAGSQECGSDHAESGQMTGACAEKEGAAARQGPVGGDGCAKHVLFVGDSLVTGAHPADKPTKPRPRTFPPRM